MGDVSKRITRKNKDVESTLPLTISAQYGLVDQRRFFNKQIASKNVSNYYLLYKGEFAYNKSYSNGFPWGAIKRLDRYDKGVLSTLYIVFRPYKVNSDYLVSYYSTNIWHKEISMQASEGARNHGLLNIASADFFNTKLNIPNNLHEQCRIGGLIKKIENAENLQQDELSNYKKLKKGLLQKLFLQDGEKVPVLRFADFHEDWEQHDLKDVMSQFIVPMRDKPKEFSGNIPWTRIEDIEGKYLNRSKSGKYVSEETIKKMNLKIIPKNSLIVSASASFGIVAVVTQRLITNQTFIGLVPKSYYNLNYLYSFFQSNTVQKQMRLKSAGSTIFYISRNTFENMNFKFPKRSEQDKIGEILNVLDNIITLQQEKLKDLQQLKKFYLQNLFI